MIRKCGSVYHVSEHELDFPCTLLVADCIYEDEAIAIAKRNGRKNYDELIMSLEIRKEITIRNKPK